MEDDQFLGCTVHDLYTCNTSHRHVSCLFPFQVWYRKDPTRDIKCAEPARELFQLILRLVELLFGPIKLDIELIIQGQLESELSLSKPWWG